MDAVLFSQGRGMWHVNASPTMRSLGDLLRSPDKGLTIVPDDEQSALHGVNAGSCPTLEEAMATIGTHLGGRCAHARRGR
jgi:hypothetical protein